MNDNPLVSLVEMGSPASPALHQRAVLHWNDDGDGRHEEGPQAFLASAFPSSFQANGRLSALRIHPYLTTEEIGFVASGALGEIMWEQEARLMTFALDPILLTGIPDEELLRVTGKLVWTPCHDQRASFSSSVHPLLLVRSFHEACPVPRVEIVPDLSRHDPLLRPMTLMLQSEIEAERTKGRLYVEALADALAVHFLRRFAATGHSLQTGRGGLSLYKLRRTITYIKAHLADELSLVRLATVEKTSPAHFARLFKHATGLAPHQYVIRCRIAEAKRLLVETEEAIIDIGLQVGCADQSHFTALFHKHVGLTPKAYRDNSKS